MAVAKRTDLPGGTPPDAGMAWIPGGTFAMGSEDFYPEERPVHRVAVDGFWMDEHPVTAAEFRRFVRETGTSPWPSGRSTRRTTRTRIPSCSCRGRWSSAGRRARSTSATIATGGSTCRARPGDGPAARARTINGRDRHPVVHVACEDAEAYAAWAGKELPTEAEWEYAARGGLEGAVFAWGDEHFPDGQAMANSWQGEFPWQNLKLDGYEGTSPVGSFPPNGYGLFDMTGNVWEWTSDWFTPRHPDEVESPCCVPRNPRVAAPDELGRRGDPPPGDQGRLAPLRAELLPPLPTRGASGAGDRLVHGAPRVPLRRPHAGGVTADSAKDDWAAVFAD